MFSTRSEISVMNPVTLALRSGSGRVWTEASYVRAVWLSRFGLPSIPPSNTRGTALSWLGAGGTKEVPTIAFSDSSSRTCKTPAARYVKAVPHSELSSCRTLAVRPSGSHGYVMT
jgi:hypothetical protein